MARNIITGLDIGSSSVRAIVVEKKKDGSLHILAAAQKSPKGSERGTSSILTTLPNNFRKP